MPKRVECGRSLEFQGRRKRRADDSAETSGIHQVKCWKCCFFLGVGLSGKCLASPFEPGYLGSVTTYSETKSVARPANSSAQARRRRAALQRILPLSVLALGLVGMPTLLLTGGGLSRLERLETEQKTVELEISRLNKRIEFLRSRAHALKTDPEAVERSARDELGLIRRTEIVFHFEPQDE